MQVNYRFASFISNPALFFIVEFIDGDGNVVIPRAVRPIIETAQTALGSKKGAVRQYRYGNLHIRDYDTHYTVHMDRVDPQKNPLGHLLVDAPPPPTVEEAAGEPLYRACGYQPVESLSDDTGGASVPLLRMRKQL